MVYLTIFAENGATVSDEETQKLIKSLKLNLKLI